LGGDKEPSGWFAFTPVRKPALREELLGFFIGEAEIDQIVHPAEQMIGRDETVVNEVAEELRLTLELVALHAAP